MAAMDKKTQIIVDAAAHGTGSEQKLLLPVVAATAALRTDTTVITADAYIPDNGARQRDESYVNQDLYKAKDKMCKYPLRNVAHGHHRWRRSRNARPAEMPSSLRLMRVARSILRLEKQPVA